MSDAAHMEMLCEDCGLSIRIDSLESDVEEIKSEIKCAIAELRAETAKLTDVFGGHIRSLAEVIMRFDAKIDHAKTAMDELTIGLAEIGISVRANMRNRTSRKSKQGKP